MKKSLVLVALTLFAVPAMAGEHDHSEAKKAAKAPVSAKAPAAYEMMRSLVGDWKGANKDAEGLKVSYSFTAGGSALIESMTLPDGSTMMTVYHPDGDNVMLTHYCHAGNQPRMGATASEGNKIHFAFVDVTNATGPTPMFMNDLVLTIGDKDHYTAQWTHKMGDKTEPMTLAMERVK